MSDFSLARQPILDSSLQLFAYELLFRGHKDDSAGVSLTSEVLATALFDIGLDSLLGRNIAFINMTYDDLMSPTIDALPSDKVVLELLEDIKIDEPFIERVQELSGQGFVFALDDFVYSSEWEPLIDSAKVIKLDLMTVPHEQNLKLIRKLQGRGIKFLAEKVETYDDFQMYKGMGCDYFQGYFLCMPEKLSGKSLTSGTLAKTQLLAEINNPQNSTDKIVELIQRDPSLTYKLIKYLNSSHFSFINPIESIKQAVVMIGQVGLKKWATLLCLRGLANKPSELTRIALTRAHLAEAAADNINASSPENYFLTGLFSTLDAMLDTEMSKIVSSMPLDEKIKAALIEQKGDLGQALKEIIEHEKQDDLTSPTMFTNEEYLQACSWADDIMSSMSNS